jgi:hypothetical protein
MLRRYRDEISVFADTPTGVFLASDDARYLTGEVISASGQHP